MTFSPAYSKQNVFLPRRAVVISNAQTRAKQFRLRMEKSLTATLALAEAGEGTLQPSHIQLRVSIARHIQQGPQSWGGGSSTCFCQTVQQKKRQHVPRMAPFLIYGAHHSQQAPTGATCQHLHGPKATKLHNRRFPSHLTEALSSALQPVRKHCSSSCYNVLVVTEPRVRSRTPASFG